MKILGQILGQIDLRIGMESGMVSMGNMSGLIKNPTLLWMITIIVSLSFGQMLVIRLIRYQSLQIIIVED